MAALEREDFGTAVNELRRATELAPEDIEFRKDWLLHREAATNNLLAKADAALAEGRDDDAVNYFRTITTFERDNSRARAGLEKIVRNARALEDAKEARKALKRGDMTQAFQLAARALESAPEQAEARAVKREIEALQSKEVQVSPSLGALYKKPINLEFRDASVKMVFDMQ